MATLYSPQLTEYFSYRSSAKQLSAWLTEHADAILQPLQFYDEHGRIGDCEGRFNQQINTSIRELIDEIAAILYEAVLLSVKMPDGVLIATLRKIEREPAAGLSRTLPGDVDRALASHYRRGKEEPGTFWPDAMRISPAGFDGKFRPPTARRLGKAAALAQRAIRLGRQKGRPSIEAHGLLARKLGSVFLRYRPRITRISEVGATSRSQNFTERGEFLDFVQAVVPALNIILRQYHLPPVTPDTVVRKATQIYRR